MQTILTVGQRMEWEITNTLRHLLVLRVAVQTQAKGV
jgi:hypothetical protein